MFKGLGLWFSSLIFRVYYLRDKVKVFTSDFLEFKKKVYYLRIKVRV
jgi:hypothetical protein